MKKIALLLICVVASVSSVMLVTACGKAKPVSLVITQPTKTTYAVGMSEIDLTGATVGVKYSDKSVKSTTAITKEMLSSYSLNTEGSVSITVNYKKLAGKIEITVEALREIGITVKTVPDKTRYSTYATKENVELYGGVLAVNLNNGLSEEKPLKVATVKSISTALGNRAVTVEYNGFSATYPIAIDEDDTAYFKTKTAPQKVKYRSDAIMDDIDLTGAEFELSIEGKVEGVYSTEVTVTKLDLEKGFIEYRIRLDGNYKYGRFGIEVVDNWVETMTVKTIPTAKSYTFHNVLSGTADLTGGVVTLTYKNGDTDEIPMNDPRISVQQFRANYTDYETGIVVLEYNDDVVLPLKIVQGVINDEETEYIIGISCRYGIAITDGTDEEIFLHCASNVSDVVWEAALYYIQNGRVLSELYPHDAGLAAAGFEYYQKLSSEQKELYEDEWAKIVSVSLYVELLEIYDSWDNFYTQFNGLLSGHDTSAVSMFSFYCDTFSAKFDTLLGASSKFNALKEFVLHRYEDETVLKVKDVVALIMEERDAIVPIYKTATEKADTAYALINAVPAEAWSKDLNTYSTQIESVFNMFQTEITAETEEDAVKSSAILRTLLTAWRWDSIDIVYEYYFIKGDYIQGTEFEYDHVKNAGQANETHTYFINIAEIATLYEAGIVPTLLGKMIFNFSNLMTSVYYSEQMTFLYDYAEYAPIIEELESYKYQFMGGFYNKVPANVLFVPANYGLSGEAGNQPVILNSIRIAIDIFHGQIAANVPYGLLQNQSFLDFVNLYGEFLWEWLPYTTWQDGYLIRWFLSDLAAVGITDYTDIFESEFREIAASFFALDFAIQGALLNALDISYMVFGSSQPTLNGISVSNFRLFADAYFEPILSSHEIDLYDATLDALSPLTSMTLYGLDSASLKEYLKQMEVLNALFAANNKLNSEFSDYFYDAFYYCIDSYADLGEIPADLYEMLDAMYMSVYNFEKFYANGDSYSAVSFGVWFLMMAEMKEDWLKYNNIEDLTGYCFNDVSIYDMTMSLENWYLEFFGTLWSTDAYLDIFNMGYALLASEGYYGSADYLTDFEKFLVDFAAIEDSVVDAEGNNGYGFDDYQRFLILQTTYDIYLSAMEFYLNENGMSATEIAFFADTLSVVYARFFLFYRHVNILYLMGYQTQDQLAEPTEMFKLAMEKCVREYDALIAEVGTLSQEFDDLGLQEMYDSMLAIYTELFGEMTGI